MRILSHIIKWRCCKVDLNFCETGEHNHDLLYLTKEAKRMVLSIILMNQIVVTGNSKWLSIC